MRAIAFLFCLTALGQTAHAEHVDFTGRFATKIESYELRRSFEYADGPLQATKVKKQIECVEQSGDGCDREGCVARIAFPLSSAKLRIASADGKNSFEVSHPVSLELWTEQKDCSAPLELSPGPSIVTMYENIEALPLEGRSVQALVYFQGQGKLALNPATGNAELRDFGFYPGDKQVIIIRDACLGHDSIFANGCEAQLQDPLKRTP